MVQLLKNEKGIKQELILVSNPEKPISSGSDSGHGRDAVTVGCGSIVMD
jgi:hypothetical protein